MAQGNENHIQPPRVEDVIATSEGQVEAAAAGLKHEEQAANDDEMLTCSDMEGSKAKKPLGFHLAFLAINIIVFVFSLDATSLAVATPVSFGPMNANCDATRLTLSPPLLN